MDLTFWGGGREPCQRGGGDRKSLKVLKWPLGGGAPGAPPPGSASGRLVRKIDLTGNLIKWRT